MYRFLNQSTFNWRRFLLTFSASTIQKVSHLTDAKHVKVFIIDDSSFDRNRSKKVELLARCFDHASLKMRFYKGFRMLTLGWSDGHSFMPVDFSLLSSKKAQINGISSEIDKRTSGYKRRVNALQTAPEQIPDMIRSALSNGINAEYVLVDSWFTMPPLVKAVVEQGLDVIGMVKETKQRYLVNGSLVSIKQLYGLEICLVISRLICQIHCAKVELLITDSFRHFHKPSISLTPLGWPYIGMIHCLPFRNQVR